MPLFPSDKPYTVYREVTPCDDAICPAHAKETAAEVSLTNRWVSSFELFLKFRDSIYYAYMHISAYNLVYIARVYEIIMKYEILKDKLKYTKVYSSIRKKTFSKSCCVQLFFSRSSFLHVIISRFMHNMCSCPLFSKIKLRENAYP